MTSKNDCFRPLDESKNSWGRSIVEIDMVECADESNVRRLASFLGVRGIERMDRKIVDNLVFARVLDVRSEK